MNNIKDCFHLESEMIDLMLYPVACIFKTTKYIREFQSGNGIPDIVLAQKIIKDPPNFNYEEFCLISALLRKRKILKEEIVNQKIEQYLVKNEYIIPFSNFYQVKKRKLNPSVGNIIAIEAKLRDWKNGFYQALRYQYFANESYLAIVDSKIKNIDKKLLKNQGIGLISINKEGAKIIIKAKRQAPLDCISNLYSSQQIAQNLS